MRLRVSASVIEDAVNDVYRGQARIEEAGAHDSVRLLPVEPLAYLLCSREVRAVGLAAERLPRHTARRLRARHVVRLR